MPKNDIFLLILTIILDSFGSQVQWFSDSSPSPKFGLGYSSLGIESGRSTLEVL